jgi:hypothetical protein
MCSIAGVELRTIPTSFPYSAERILSRNRSAVHHTQHVNLLMEQNLQQIEELRQQLLGYLVESGFVFATPEQRREISQCVPSLLEGRLTPQHEIVPWQPNSLCIRSSRIRYQRRGPTYRRSCVGVRSLPQDIVRRRRWWFEDNFKFATHLHRKHFLQLFSMLADTHVSIRALSTSRSAHQNSAHRT